MEHEMTRSDGSLPGPHLRLRPGEEAPNGFVPLRLVLQPGGAVVEADRPDVVIGRHTDSDVRLPLPDVSRRHCRLSFAEGHWQVVDLNSLNGVFVNGEQVTQAALVPGDRLKVGGFTFEVEYARHETAAGHVESILKTLSVGPQRKAS